MSETSETSNELPTLDSLLGLPPLPAPTEDPNRSVIRDTGRALAAGGAGFLSTLAGAGEYVAGSGGALTRAREGLEDFAAGQVQSMSPQMQRARSREWLPGGTNPDGTRRENVWQDGFVGALAAQTLEALPSLFATVIPGGVLAKGMQVAGYSQRAIRAGTMAVGAGAGAASLAGEVFNGVTQTLQNLTDEERSEQSPFYRNLRAQGVEEGVALDRTIREAAGYLPLLGAAIGGATGGLLEGRAVADVVTGRAGGVVRGALRGAAAEAPGEAIEGVAGEGLTQVGNNRSIGAEFDLREVAQAGVQGVAVGGAMGAGVGGLGGAFNQRRDPEGGETAPGVNLGGDPSFNQAMANALAPPAPPAPPGVTPPSPIFQPGGLAAAGAATPSAITGTQEPDPSQMTPPEVAPTPGVTPPPGPSTAEPVQQLGLDPSYPQVAEPEATPGIVEPAPEPVMEPQVVAPEPQVAAPEPVVEVPPAPVVRISPAAQTRLAAAGLTPADVTPTGKNGMVTVADVQRAIAARDATNAPSAPETPAIAPSLAPPVAPEGVTPPAATAASTVAPAPSAPVVTEAAPVTPPAPVAKPPKAPKSARIAAIRRTEEPALVSEARSILDATNTDGAGNAALDAEAASLVRELLDDAVSEVDPNIVPGALSTLLLERVREAATARRDQIVSERAAKEAAEDPDGAEDAAGTTDEEWARITPERLVRALRGDAVEARAVISAMSRMPRKNLRKFYDSIFAPAARGYTETGKPLPEWAASFRDIADYRKKGGSTEQRAARTKAVDDWRAPFAALAENVAGDAGALRGQIESLFDALADTGDAVLKRAAERYTEFAKVLEQLTGRKDWESQLKVIDDATSRAAAIVRFIGQYGATYGKQSDAARKQAIIAAELGMRDGDAFKALADLRQSLRADQTEYSGSADPTVLDSSSRERTALAESAPDTDADVTTGTGFSEGPVADQDADGRQGPQANVRGSGARVGPLMDEARAKVAPPENLKTYEQILADVTRFSEPNAAPEKLEASAKKIFARQQAAAAARASAAENPQNLASAKAPVEVSQRNAMARDLHARTPLGTVYADTHIIAEPLESGVFLTAVDGTPLIADVWAILKDKGADVPIQVYSDAEWDAAQKLDPTGADLGTAALFSAATPDSIRLGGQPGVIMIPERLLRNPDSVESGTDLREAVMHELTHAVQVASIAMDTTKRAQVTKLMALVKRHVAKKGSRNFSNAMAYALSSPDEFVAMGNTNERFQQELMAIPVTPEEARGMGLTGRVENAFRAFVSWIRGVLGGKAKENALYALVEISSGSFQSKAERAAQMERLASQGEREYADDKESPVRALNVLGAVAKAFTPEGRGIDVWQRLKDVGLAFSTTRQLEQMADGLFSRTPAMSLIDPNSNATPEQQLVMANNSRPEIAKRVVEDVFMPALRELTALKAQQRELVESLLTDSTVAEVHADNPSPDSGTNEHLGKGVGAKAWGRAQHAGLHARYNALSPEGKSAYRAVVASTKKAHELMIRTLMENLVQRSWAANVEKNAADPVKYPLLVKYADLKGLTERLLKGPPTQKLLGANNNAVPPGYLTPADEALFEDSILRVARDIRQRAKMAGPYVPQMRFGDFVVTWKEGAQPVHTFTNMSDADNFEATSVLPVLKRETKHYDANGDEITQPDAKTVADELGLALTLLGPNATQEQIKVANFQARKKGMAVARAAGTPKYIVTVQTQGVAYFDKLSEANTARRALIADGKLEVSEVDRRKDASARIAAVSDADFNRLIESVQSDKSLPEAYREKAAQSLRDAMVLITPNRLLNASLIQRRKVLGASADVGKVLANYAVATGNYKAGIDTSLPITEALRVMREQARDGRVAGTKTFSDDSDTLRRRTVLRELEERVSMSAMDTSGRGSTIPILRKAQALAYVYYLASPSYAMIQLTQPYLLSLPVMSARHGGFKTSKAMAKAMSAIGMGKLIKGGVTDTYEALKGLATAKDATSQPFLAQVKASLASQPDSANLIAMLDKLAAEGLVDASAGTELIRSELGEDGPVGRFLGRTETLARALPNAVEALNRAGTAVAAYRLERAKGATHEQATMYARKVVDQTQMDYSSANTARYMDARKYPLLAPMMTFRKYAQGMYALFVRQAYLAVKGRSKEERQEAFKALAGVLAAHMAVAGALGLPTEFLGIILGAASLLFGADEPWDWEKEIRQALAEAVGPEAAEVIAKGLPRAAGLDLSSRIGLNGLIFMKDLRDFESRTLTGYAGEFILGAPGGMVATALGSVGSAMDGDYGRALEGVTPKGIRDGLRTARFLEDGITTRRGERIDGNREFDTSEIVMMALGFTPAAVAETYERRDAVQGAARTFNAQRVQLMRQWRQAEPTDRADVWARIQAWNQDIPPEGRDARITRANLIQSLNEANRRARASGGEDYLPPNREFLRREGAYTNSRN